jgi:hypothetical protein
VKTETPKTAAAAGAAHELTKSEYKRLLAYAEANDTANSAKRTAKTHKDALFARHGTAPANLMYQGRLVGLIGQGIWNGLDQDGLKTDEPQIFAKFTISKPYPKLEVCAIVGQGSAKDKD